MSFPGYGGKDFATKPLPPKYLEITNEKGEQVFLNFAKWHRRVGYQDTYKILSELLRYHMEVACLEHGGVQQKEQYADKLRIPLFCYCSKEQ